MSGLFSQFASFNVDEWTTFLIGVAMCCAPFLQIRMMWKAKAANAISLGVFLIFLAGSAVWFRHGVIGNDPSLYLPEAIGIVANGLAVGLIIHYRRASARETYVLATAKEVGFESGLLEVGS